MLDLDRLPISLEGANVRLAALTEAHREPLRTLAKDERIWRFYPLRGHDREAFNAWFDMSLEEARQKITWPYAAYDRTTSKLVGSIRYEFIVPEHDRLSLGGTWLHSDFWRAGFNTGMNHLLLDHAFHGLKSHRVEIRVDTRNESNIAAWRSFGATEEGTLRGIHREIEGLYADRTIFSVLAHEWPAVEARLQAKMVRHG